jgi:hypothetical protein
VRKIFYLVSLMLMIHFLTVPVVFGEDAPTFYNSYDGAVIGARAIGMGEAYVGVADTPDTIYWNPAGLVKIQKNSFDIGFNIQTAASKENLDEVLNTDPLKGGKLLYLSFAGSQGGLSWRPLSNFKKSTYTENLTTNTQSWDTKEIRINQFMLSLAVPYTDKMSVGFNINYLSGNLAVSSKSKTAGVWNEPVANVSAGYGFGVDMGLLYKVTPFMNLGVMMQNLAAYLYWDDYARDKLPFNLRIGTAIKLTDFLTFAYDYEKRFYPKADEVESYHLGLEQVIFKAMALRLGIYGKDWNDSKLTTYTYGLGYFRDNYHLDFAMKKNFVNLAAPGTVPVYTSEAVFTYLCSVTIPF